MVEFVVMPAVIMGAAIGIYEAILLHRDVKVPTHRFVHMMHALGFAILAVFGTMNVEWLLETFTALQGIAFLGTPLVLQIAIGLIAVIKIHGTSAAIRTSIGGISVGMKETWAHSLMIGALIVLAPYIWPLISTVLPGWLQ